METDGEHRATLRALLRERRAALTAVERIRAAGSVAEQLEQIPEFLTDPHIAGYWAIDGELPLAGVLGALRERGQIFHLPIVTGKLLRFGAWRAGDPIVSNRFGIPEPAVGSKAQLGPEQLDLVLVPLLGFDRRGQRLGLGGGFYDRSFAFLRERRAATYPLLIGVGFACQEVDAIATMPWDVPLDFVATENELIRCMPLPA